MPTDPHKPLRDDVRLLGELLGDTLKAHAGEHVFRTVERVRAAEALGLDDAPQLRDGYWSVGPDDGSDPSERLDDALGAALA